jgi:hypothetical protein
MRPLAPAPPAAPLPRRSEAERGGGLVVLLLAERAPSEGPRSTRAIEDQPGHLLEKQTSKAWRDHCPLNAVRVWNQAPPLRRKSLDASCFLESMEPVPVAHRPVQALG